MPGRRWLPAAAGLLLLSGCAHESRIVPSQGHIQLQPEAAKAERIPPPVTVSGYVPPPKARPKPQTYTVVVNEVPAKELLFALARDTKLNIDVHPAIRGLVTLNAINETLPAILDRIAQQVNIRYKQDGDTLVVTPDTPYLHTYRVNYVNLARDTTSSIDVSTQIASTGTVGAGGPAGQQGGIGNGSRTSVTTTSSNNFWEILTRNLHHILSSTRAAELSQDQRADRAETARAAREERLRQAEAVSRAGSAAATLFTAAFGGRSTGQGDDGKDDVIVNPVAGTVSVLASQRQQVLIQQYLDSVQASVQRQVLIEATIVEVALKDQYRAGVDWSRLSNQAGFSFGATPPTVTGFTFQTTPGGTSNLANTLSPFFSIGYSNQASAFSIALSLLESYGKTRVLSSPKIMALNNQTALLKVVDNVVYFSVDVQPGTNLAGGGSTNPTYSTTAHTVPVGVVMSVTPQISGNGVVSLTVRPTISRIVGVTNDPNPELAKANPPVKNPVPEIQVREMESVLQVNSGQTVILGGLMQDDSAHARDGIPGLSEAEGVGGLFGQREEQTSQTELVIFLRPTVITNPSLDSDELKFYRRYLPSGTADGGPQARTPQSP